MTQRPAWYRGATPRAVLAAIVLTGFAVATQGLLTRGQSDELRVARSFLTALYAGEYDLAASLVAPDVAWLDEPEELRSLIEPFRGAAGVVTQLTAASAQRESDEVREVVYCVEGSERDVAGRVEVRLGTDLAEPRVAFLSRFFSQEPCQSEVPSSPSDASS